MTTYSTRNAWASGLMLFAAAVMLTVGLFQILQGIAALAQDDVMLVGPEYTYTFDLTAWGWIHLLMGAVLIGVGAFLFTGAAWARWAGIAVAILCMAANFMWLPHYPFWAITLIGMNIAVIWALAVVEIEPDFAPPAR
jgi:hypothetical protein